MGAFLRRKVLLGVAAVVGLLVVALLVAPSFIDLDARKRQIIAEVKKATGRDLTIAGPISLSLLPTPTVTATGVTFANATGAKEPQMADLKSVTVRPALFALLLGRIEPGEVILVEPRIVLEIDGQGKPNWEFAAAPKSADAMPMALDRLVIENGTVLVSDLEDGVALTAEKVNVVASVGSLDGPYALNGTATVRGAPMKVDLSVGAKSTNGHAVAVTVAAKGGQLGFNGTASEISPKARLAGTATVSAEQLITFVGTLAACVGEPVPVLPALLSGKLGFEGRIEASLSSLSAKDFKLTLGDSTGTGSLSVALQPSLAIEGKVSMPRLDLDRILAALTQIPVDVAPNTAATSGSGIAANATARVALEVKELVYHKAAVRDVAVELDARGGVVALPRLEATLPGGMEIKARSSLSGDPAKPTVSGDFSLAGPKLRETLAWLEIDVTSVPAGKLARLDLKGRMSSINGNVDVQDAVFELDDMKATGAIVVNFGVPLSIVTTIEADTVDLDAYLATRAAGRRPAAGRSAPTEASLWTAIAPSLGLKAKIAKLIYNGEAIAGVDVDLTLGTKTLTFTDVKVADLAGAKLDVRGSITDYGTTLPRPDISFHFDAPDLSRVLGVAGAAAPAGIGHVTASGAISGTIEALSLANLSVSVMGYTSRATGLLAMPGASQGMPQSVSWKGNLGLSGHVIEGTIEAKLTGRPYVTADLRTTVLDLDKLASGGGAHGRPAPSASAASLPTFDTAPFRKFDATIKVAAATLVNPASQIGNADLSATLKDGVLTIQHFKGGVYGGTLEMSGVVDLQQPALSFDVKGNASNLSIGEMLRSAKGSNQFGNSLYPVTVSGKLDATAIVLKGTGASADQIKHSMTGGAQLGGHVDVVADKFLTAVGAAVTGVAGGVIDNTIGTAMSVLGDKRGVPVGNLLNAISLVLNRYINRNNPISGHVEIAGGVMADRNLIVQGSGVTAHVNTRTSFAASTTDTTISFVLAEDPSAPYLIASVRGSTSNPSYDVVRGTAKDPPGFVNTLTEGAGRAIHQLPHVPLPSIHIPNPFR
jgi:uncharacterized protein involved in outer membrane biogenesis